MMRWWRQRQQHETTRQGTGRTAGRPDADSEPAYEVREGLKTGGNPDERSENGLVRHVCFQLPHRSPKWKKTTAGRAHQCGWGNVQRRQKDQRKACTSGGEGKRTHKETQRSRGSASATGQARAHPGAPSAHQTLCGLAKKVGARSKMGALKQYVLAQDAEPKAAPEPGHVPPGPGVSYSDPTNAQLLAAADEVDPPSTSTDAPPAAVPLEGPAPGPMATRPAIGKELLPLSWRKTLPVEQQEWVGRALVRRDPSSGKAVLTTPPRLSGSRYRRSSRARRSSPAWTLCLQAVERGMAPGSGAMEPTAVAGAESGLRSVRDIPPHRWSSTRFTEAQKRGLSERTRGGRW
ncbi:unnamed protein product [Gadus morhua 'NCC']